MAGLEFFAPKSRQNLDTFLDRIHQRADTMTAVLEGILQHQEPAPRWN